jgi:trehalose-6-phosphate hydrolase
LSFKEEVIYQIYPKSYKDTNGDGIGDIKGIIEKLPYLKNLGIDKVWLNPIYPSPQNDNGYDISDYMAIDPIFGSMEDFENLIKEGKELEIEFMMDMVLNHVSTEHIWFKKALEGDKKYQDFFIIRDTPTDWVSKFGGSAWAAFGDTGKYYLHLFDITQADLNWRNKEVREELFEVVRFWMGKGVKGFRFDVINLIGKDEVLKNNSENEGKAEYTDKLITHDYLIMLNENSFGKDENIITVGEMSSTTIENCILYTAPDRNELSMTFNFHHLKVDYENGQKWSLRRFDFKELKRLFNVWGEGMCAGNGWNALFFNNHDQPRALNRFVDVKNYRIEGAKMLAASIHLNRGTPYIYMGEEIGMTDPDFDSIESYVDVESINAYKIMLANGKTKDEAFEIIKSKSRDNSRVPMQWDESDNSGFSTVKPWLSIGKSYKEINVKKELEAGSIFKFYQELIKLRKKYKVISHGDYAAYAEEHGEVYGYIRKSYNEKLLVLNNFYGKETEIEIPEEFVNGKVLIENYQNTKLEKIIKLKPFHTIAVLRREVVRPEDS